MKLLFFAIIILFIASCKPDEPVKPVETKPTKYDCFFFASGAGMESVEINIQNDTQKIVINRKFPFEYNKPWDTTLTLKPGAKGYYTGKIYNSSLKPYRFIAYGEKDTIKFTDKLTFELPK